jgi:hypothetical protein
MLATLPNRNPTIRTHVRIQTPYSGACPHSGMPLPGSWIAVCYWPADVILGLDSVAQHLPTYATEAIDVETVAQLLARDCAITLGMTVIVEAHYLLRDGIELDVTCS